MKVVISNDFSETPGGRYKKEGKYSGEEFREKLLAVCYLEAKEKGEKLVVDLDGTYGYATSFLDEAFGGLARKFKSDDILKIIEFKSDDQPGLVDDILSYIRTGKVTE